MKLKYILIFTPLLFSCGTRKKASCDAYTEYVYKDTITLTTEHIHLDNRCSSDTTLRVPITETFIIKLR